MSEDFLQPIPHLVTRKWQETGDSVTLGFRTEQSSLPSIAPGQFNMLYVFGIGEIPISMGGQSESEGELLHTIQGVGKVSQALCRMEPGDIVGIRGPYGTSWPMEKLKEKNPMIIAGGLGLAPLRPVIQQLIAQPNQFGKTSLFYGARTPNDVLYKDSFPLWREAFEGQAFATVDFADASWSGDVGVVSDLLPSSDNFENRVALICGPEVMIRFTIAELRSRGLPADDIYVSMERNMKCAVGLCGHCQFVGDFVCKDGAVFSYSHVERFFGRQEI